MLINSPGQLAMAEPTPAPDLAQMLPVAFVQRPQPNMPGPIRRIARSPSVRRRVRGFTGGRSDFFVAFRRVGTRS
jgi:hypothetical protein